MNYYLPRAYQKDILSINYDKLKKLGIKVIAYDFDNTIIEKGNYQIKQEIVDLFDILKKDFKIIILSNTSKKSKISLISGKLKIEYVLLALKPLPFGFNKVKNKYNVSYDQICLIGDQLYTDVKGANKLGIYSILVDQINNNETFFTKINRLRERQKIKQLNKFYSFEKGAYYD